MQPIRVLCLLLTAALLCCCCCHCVLSHPNPPTPTPTSKLLQVNVISRHCDRLPSSSVKIPTDPIDWPLVSGLALGDLTGLGQQQCKTLGDNLRRRYLDRDGVSPIEGMSSPRYNASHFAFRSTNFDRCLNSMMAISMGLFPSGTGDRATVNYQNRNDRGSKHFALPHGQQAVPIHTVEDANESLLLGFSYCNTVLKRTNTAFGTKVLAYLNENRQFLNTLYNVTGWTMGDAGVSTLVDLLVVQKQHNMLHLQWVHDNWDTILQLRDHVLSLLYSYEVIGKEGSSVLVSTLIDNMVQLKKKYIHYSAHDSTLQALTGSLKLNVDYAHLGGQPNYGAHVVVELHEMANGNKTVRIMHGSQYDDNALSPLVMTSLGCQTEYCPLELFKSLTNGVSMTSTWCADCNNKSQNVCAAYYLSIASSCTSV